MAGSIQTYSQTHPSRPAVAVILAGGLGTRLHSRVSDRPKVLALAAGQPFLHYQLTFLASQGIEHVILALGYMADRVRDYVGDGKDWNLAIDCVIEDSPLGTAGALQRASAGIDSPFFVLNGDTLFTINLDDLCAAHFKSTAAATLALKPVKLDSQQSSLRGVITLDQNNIIHEFLEKPAAPRSNSLDQLGLINGGIYLLTPSAVQSIPPGQACSLETQVFPELAKTGQLAGYVQDAYFIDIGTPESLAVFEADILAGHALGQNL